MTQQANSKKDLVLFQFTQPDLMDGLFIADKKNDAGVTTSFTLSQENRKAVAKRLGLTMNKDNASQIDKEILRMKDALKTAAFGEFAKLATDPNWTGGAFRIAQSKNGQRRATLSLVTVNRSGHTLTEEQLVKALANLSEDEQVALMEKSEAFKRGLNVIQTDAAAPAAQAPVEA